MSAQASESAKKGAEHVGKGKAEVSQGTRAKSPGERREERAAAPPQVSDENALANQAGERGGRVNPQRRPQEDPNSEDGASLVESAKAQARAQGRDGKVDRGAFRAMLNGEPTQEGEDRVALNSTSLVALSEELHQESDDLAEGAAELVDRAKDDPASMTPDEQAAALSMLYMREGLLETEDETLDVLASGEESADADVARGLDQADSDGVLDGNNTPVAGLEQEDIEARRAEIADELEQNQADIDAIIASMSADDAAAIATLSDGGGVATIVDENGEEISVEVDEQVVARIAEDHAAHVETGAELVTDSEGPVDGTEGTEGGGDAPAAPPMTDEELIAAAAAEGVIDPEAQGQFSFNTETGELMYAAQPGDGYWQAAEHVAPPAGQDFATHWQNTWTENSMRNHGVPNEQFVAIDQQIVIPGYTRDMFEAAYAPVVDPAVDPAAGADGGDEAYGEPLPAGDPAEPTSIPVEGVAFDEDTRDTVVVVGDAGEITVPGENWAPAGQQRESGSEYERTVEPVTIESPTHGTYQAHIQYDFATNTYSVHEVTTPPAGGGTAAEDADEPEPEPDPEPETVMVGDHEVQAEGIDAVRTSGGGSNVYYNGQQVAHTYTDNSFNVSANSSDELIEAMLADGSLTIGDEGFDGDRDYTLNGEEVEEGSALELALETLTDHYFDDEGLKRD